MSRAEEYIKKYTKKCSNLDSWDEPIPWLTPYHAEQVAQIAREEVIEKAAQWFRKWMTLYGINLTHREEYMNEFYKAMEDKV